SWAEAAIAWGGREAYKGKTSPHWYDEDGIWELCQASRGLTVRELIAKFFDGCSEPAAGKIAAVVGRGRLACELGRVEAGMVLAAMKARAKPVNPKRLGCLGPDAVDAAAYAKRVGVWRPAAGVEIPAVVEAWAGPVEGDGDVYFHVNVNRTPIAAR